MKIIHCSDLHLNSPLKEFPSELAKTRREEMLSNFERLTEYANKNQVRVVIIAGDLFDNCKASIKTLTRIATAISNAPDTDFLYLVGNHDKTQKEEFSDFPDNFKCFGYDWTHYVYDNVDIAGVSFNAVNCINCYDTLNFNEQNVNIAVMHGQVAGYKSNEVGEIVSIPKLKDKFIDYLALGHIHSYSSDRIDLRGSYAYSGCLDGRGFDEIGVKGFVLLEVENKSLKHEFVPFYSRLIREFVYEVPKGLSGVQIVNDIIAKCSTVFNSKDVVSVVVKGELSGDVEINFDSLKYKLNQEYFYARVKDNTSIKIDENSFSYDKSIKGEFVRAVMSSKLSEQDKSKIIMFGLKSLKGEDV